MQPSKSSAAARSNAKTIMLATKAHKPNRLRAITRPSLRHRASDVPAVRNAPPAIAQLGERLGRKLKDVGALSLQAVEPRRIHNPATNGIGLVPIKKRSNLTVGQPQTDNETSPRVFLATRPYNADRRQALVALGARIKSRATLADPIGPAMLKHDLVARLNLGGPVVAAPRECSTLARDGDG